MSNRPVVVTGVGILCLWGEGREAFREGLAARRCALGPVGTGEIRGFDPLRYLPPKGLRGIERPSQLLLAAAVLALRDACLELGEETRERTAVVVGSAFSTASDLSRYVDELLREGPLLLNPGDWPRISPSSPSSRLSIHFGLRGPSLTLCGVDAGLEALAEAASLIRAGAAEVVLAGAVDELSPERLGRLRSLGETVTPGEAAVVLVLEAEGRGRGRATDGWEAAGRGPARAELETLLGDCGATAGLLAAAARLPMGT